MLAALVVAGAAWSGCGGKKATEYVAGFSTQTEVPRDLQSIIIRVDVNGQNAFQHSYPVYDGTVRLPKTLGVFKESTPPGTPVTISVYGFSVVDQDTRYSAYTNPLNPPTVGTIEGNIGNNGGARILRASRQPYQEGQVLYLPMPLHYSCFDVDCGPKATQSDPKLGPLCADGTCTCKAGQCVAPDTDPTTLPPYSDDLIYGTTNTCFRVFTNNDPNGNQRPGCMDHGLPPQVLDARSCIFALPDTPSVPGDAAPYTGLVPLPYIQAADFGGGLNVRVVYDGRSSEVLDYEGACPTAAAPGPGPQEGYCAFPGAPQRFQLAPGLCAMYRNDATAPHVISLVEASAACPPKTEFQPICDDTIQGPPQPNLPDGGYAAGGLCGAGGYPLTPAPSALYVLFDTSTGMRDFVGNAGAAQALSLSLQDPVFKQTVVGMKFMPAQASDCSGGGLNNAFSNPAALDVPFEDSFKAQADIATKLEATGPGDGGTGNLPPDNGPWYMEAALEGAYAALDKLPSQGTYNRRAVMLFFDRDFNRAPPDCPGPQPDAILEAQTAVANTQQIETYVVFLANADYPDGGVPGNPFANAKSLAQGLAPCPVLGQQPCDRTNQYFFNATNGANAGATAVAALGSVVADLGSCVYEPTVRAIGPGLSSIGPDWTLTFADEVAGGALVNVVNAPDCLADDATTHPLWVYDNRHVRICQNTCDRLVKSNIRNELQSAALAQALGVTAPATGISVNANPPPLICDGGAPVDATIIESGSGPAGVDSGVGPVVDSGSGAPADASLDASTD